MSENLMSTISKIALGACLGVGISACIIEYSGAYDYQTALHEKQVACEKAEKKCEEIIKLFSND